MMDRNFYIFLRGKGTDGQVKILYEYYLEKGGSPFRTYMEFMQAFTNFCGHLHHKHMEHLMSKLNQGGNFSIPDYGNIIMEHVISYYDRKFIVTLICKEKLILKFI